MRIAGMSKWFGIALAATAMTAATAQDGYGAKKADVKVGTEAPAFVLMDTMGKKHDLKEYAQKGHTVVIEWFSPDCPFVVKHYDGNSTTTDIEKTFKDEKVTWLRINSNNQAFYDNNNAEPAAHNQKARDGWKIDGPVLLDVDGKVGKMFGATRTPEIFIVGADGMVKYHGALCSDRGASNIGETVYAHEALRQVLAGETVTMSQTRPYGCTIKY
ncbi:MAG: redoxin family protein [Planctomycetota bacterium]